MIKTHINALGENYDKRALDNPREYIIESETIATDAFRHSIKWKSYIGLKYVIKATKDLMLTIKLNDLIVEEIMWSWDAKKTKDIFLLLISSNAMLENEDEKTKQLEHYVSEIRQVSSPQKKEDEDNKKWE